MANNAPSHNADMTYMSFWKEYAIGNMEYSFANQMPFSKHLTW